MRRVMAPGDFSDFWDPSWGPTWPRDIPNLDQGHSQLGPWTFPTWTRDMPNLDQGHAQPGPGKWLNLDQGHAQPGPGTCPTWTRDMLNLGQEHAQPGPGTGPTWTRHGPNLDQARALTWNRHKPGPQNHLSEPGLYSKKIQYFYCRIQDLPKSRPGGLPKVQADSCASQAVDFK